MHIHLQSPAIKPEFTQVGINYITSPQTSLILYWKDLSNIYME